MWVQISAEVEDFHCTSVCAVHFQICNHSAACCSELGCFTFSLILSAECEQFIHAFLGFQRAARLSLSDVSTEISVCHALGALRDASLFFQMIFLDYALLLSAGLFVCNTFDNRQTVVGLYITVASSEGDTDSRHASIQKFVIAK